MITRLESGEGEVEGTFSKAEVESKPHKTDISGTIEIPYEFIDAPIVVKGSDITVQYQDEVGKTISDDVVLEGNVGETYTSTKKDIANHSFKEVKGSALGKFTDQSQTVTYVYTKI